MKMTNGSTVYILLSILLSPSVIANGVESCLRDYENRYNADSEAGEALPPMRNLYPDWEEDCENGGVLNEKIKLSIKDETKTAVPAEILETGFQGKWLMQEDLNLNLGARLPVYTKWISITSTTDYKVHIQDVIINKGRCSAVVYPSYLLKPTTFVDYGHTFKITGQGCAIHEATIITDIGTTVITP
ncbi:hypothetical protein [Aeromonas veronii]|uniref:hypothetical protein n=1 Tax=Aeromonas veronii TaxID=654 RepID=UPI001302785A|nr:hypothetical protein [Aeromonas veronii]KAE9626355.1 hypothetical protein GO627_05190 [Aeromonas veronii]